MKLPVKGLWQLSSFCWTCFRQIRKFRESHFLHLLFFKFLLIKIINIPELHILGWHVLNSCSHILGWHNLLPFTTKCLKDKFSDIFLSPVFLIPGIISGNSCNIKFANTKYPYNKYSFPLLRFLFSIHFSSSGRTLVYPPSFCMHSLLWVQSWFQNYVYCDVSKISFSSPQAFCKP